MTCDPKTCVVSNNGTCSPLCADYNKRNKIDTREHAGRIGDGLKYIWLLPCRNTEQCKSCKFTNICFWLNMAAGGMVEAVKDKALKNEFFAHVDRIKANHEDLRSARAVPATGERKV